MKKMLSLGLVLVMVVSMMAVSFADVTEGNGMILEEVTEDVLFDEVADDMIREAQEASLSRHGLYEDEFRLLYQERQKTKDLVQVIDVKRVEIAVLKEVAKENGEFVKLRKAALIEEEVQLLKGVIEKIQAEKEEFWQTFKVQIIKGQFLEAEKTLKKIVVAKKAINLNLTGINHLLTREIIVLK